MATVAVRKLSEIEILPSQLQEELESLSERIRARAYELYLARGAENGREIEDWLRAEREVAPETQLREEEGEFQARIFIEGLEPRELEVIAMRDAILVEAPRQAKVLGRLDLPKAIDPRRVTAKLEKGVLQVICPKGAQAALTAAQAG
jgi:HSP20 family molecular chaperone IbpA